MFLFVFFFSPSYIGAVRAGKKEMSRQTTANYCSKYSVCYSMSHQHPPRSCAFQDSSQSLVLLVAGEPLESRAPQNEIRHWGKTPEKDTETLVSSLCPFLCLQAAIRCGASSAIYSQDHTAFLYRPKSNKPLNHGLKPLKP